MERFTLSKSEKQTIFEIYRACRLCGSSGGYRMPIIQNIVDFDGSNVELKQKIQDCLQLEVRPDDRMPPLICELCVDKVNDFYKFMRLAQQTNIWTRTKLGLPLQTVDRGKKVETDNTDCILGDIKPSQEEVKPVAKKSKAGPKCFKKVKEETVKEEVTLPSPRESRSSSVSRPSKSSNSKPTSQSTRVQIKSTPKATQHVNPLTPVTPQPSKSQPSKTTKVTQATHEKSSSKEKKGPEKEVKENEIKKNTRLNKELQNLLEDNASFEDNSLLVPRAQKRIRENDIPKPLIIPKRPKPTPKEPIEPPKEATPPRPKPRPKSKQDPKNVPTPLKVPKKKPEETPPPPPKPEPPRTFNCVVCNVQLKTVQAVTNHTRYHVPNYTKPQNACNPCNKWFPTTEEANTHHRYHRSATFPYHCRRCFEDFKTLPEYDLHIANNKCVPWETVPDVKCEQCWKTFPTDNIRKAHKCAGIDARPGGKCSKCSKTYATSKSLKKHESSCNQRRKRDLIADPDVLRRLKPMQVRISRCDDLLGHSGEYVNVSNVKPNYGLDRQYLYPYMKYKAKIKSTYKAKPASKQEHHTHWDSDTSDDDTTQVHKLSTLCIKKLFSKQLIGKVPKERRKNKQEESGFESINKDISDIINSFEDDEEEVVVGASKNELLMASLNDIIGVPEVSSANVDSYGNNEEILREKSEMSIQNATLNAENSDKGNDKVDSIGNDEVNTALTENSVSNETQNIIENNSVGTGNDNILSNDDNLNNSAEKSENVNQNETQYDSENSTMDTGNDTVVNVNINHSECALTEKNETSNENETQDVAEETGNDKVLSNESYIKISDCNTVQTEKSEVPNQNDTKESTENTVNYNINRKENDKALSKNSEILNKNDQHVAEDTRNDDVDINDVNINKTALNDTENKVSIENADDTSNYRGNETVVSNENENLNISSSAKEPEIVLNESMPDKTVSGEVFSAISDISTNPQLEDNKNINDTEITENNCDNELSNQEELLNNFESNSIKETEDTIESEHVDNVDNNEVCIKIGTNSVDLETHMADSVDNEGSPLVKGLNNHDQEAEQSKSRSNESDIKKIEVNNATKESPIKHSIENIIGDSDKNPERYIDEVISSLENIIKKNPRTEEKVENFNGDIQNDIDDQNLLDALDAQIGEESKSDNEKITLEDLLTNEDRPMELDDISDDDFNFDA